MNQNNKDNRNVRLQHRTFQFEVEKMAFKRGMAYFLLFTAVITLIFSSDDIPYLTLCQKACDDQNTSCLKDINSLMEKFECNSNFTICKDNCKKKKENQPKLKNLKLSFQQQLHKKMTSIWRKNAAK